MQSSGPLGCYISSGAGVSEIKWAGGKLRISFRRTIPVPISKSYHSYLPGDLGHLPLYEVSKFREIRETETGGFFFPLGHDEAFFIRLDSALPFTVRIFLGCVNIISGQEQIEPKEIEEKSKQEHSFGQRWWISNLATLFSKTKPRTTEGAPGRVNTQSEQDYVILPEQKFIDGVATVTGEVRQFVGARMGSRYSVEAQVTGKDLIGGFRFEIIPSFEVVRPPSPELSRQIKIYGSGIISVTIKTLTGRAIKISVELDYTVYTLKSMIHDFEGFPPDQQRLMFRGHQLEDDKTLSSYDIQKDSLLLLTLRLRGGGEEPRMKKIVICPGGFIKQIIWPDRHQETQWANDRKLTFKVHIVDSGWFKRVKRIELPQQVLDSEQYNRLGLQYFKDEPDKFVDSSSMSPTRPDATVRGGFSDLRFPRSPEKAQITKSPEAVTLNAQNPDRAIPPSLIAMKRLEAMGPPDLT